MFTYINKDAKYIYVELEEQLDPESNVIGETWEDYLNVDNCWVLLTDEQLAFKEANPDASVEEVFKMELITPPGPTPEELLNKAKLDKQDEAFAYRHSDNVQIAYYNETSLWTYDWLPLKDDCDTAIRHNSSTVTIAGVEMPPKVGLYLLDMLKPYDLECAQNCNEIVESILACTTVEQVSEIDVTVGYPEPIHVTEQSLEAEIETYESDQPQVQTVMMARMMVNTMAFTDQQALSIKNLYPEWSSFIGESLDIGMRVLHEDKLYNVRMKIDPVLESQPPSIDTAALYEEINEEHSGTKDDPIPFNNNMELKLGLYYTQNGVLYMCSRDSQQPVYQDLSELVGIYVVIV